MTIEQAAQLDEQEDRQRVEVAESFTIIPEVRVPGAVLAPCSRCRASRLFMAATLAGPGLPLCDVCRGRVLDALELIDP